MMELPEIFTPKQLSEKLGCSERTLRGIARKHGCCHVIGNAMIFTASDIDALLEAVRPEPKARAHLPKILVAKSKPRRSEVAKLEIVPIPFRRDRNESK